MEIVFKICGKEIYQENLKDPLEADVLSGRTRLIERAVGDFRCSEHGGYPVVIFEGRNVENLECSVGGCCNKFVEGVQRRLSVLL